MIFPTNQYAFTEICWLSLSSGNDMPKLLDTLNFSHAMSQSVAFRYNLSIVLREASLVF